MICIIGLFMAFSRFCPVAFAEITSFKSSGVIYRSLLLSLLPGKLPIVRRDSNELASRYNKSCYNMTWLVTDHPNIAAALRRKLLSLYLPDLALFWNTWYCNSIAFLDINFLWFTDYSTAAQCSHSCRRLIWIDQIVECTEGFALKCLHLWAVTSLSSSV